MAMNKIQNQALHELVDPTLGYDSDSKVKEMINDVAELAFRCLQNSKDYFIIYLYMFTCVRM